jgi:flagellar biosynthesis anti-sigma factor FlgM
MKVNNFVTQQSYNNDMNSQKKTSKAESTKEVSLSKVDAIKEQIANGTYKIDLDSTASKMAEKLLGG